MAKQDTEKAIGSKEDILLLEPKYFGPFWEYVEDDNITDVDFNGTDLWITDAKNRRTKIEDHGVTADFVQAFSQRVANQVSKPFNKMNNLLEAETKTLRISILHESAAVSGRSLCIRKTLPTVRITPTSIVSDKYMPRPIMNLLANCIMAKMNFVIGGEPGAGKDLADSTPVPVPYSKKYPEGWAKHGNLAPGDQVYMPDGSIAEIDFVTPGRDLDLYEIEFSDGQVIKASDTHLWKVSSHKDRKHAVSCDVNNGVLDQELKRLHDLAASVAGSMAAADAETIAICAGTDPDVIRRLMNDRNIPSMFLSGRDTWPLDEAVLAFAESLEGSREWNYTPTKILSTKELYQQVVTGNGHLNWAVRIPEAVDGPNLGNRMDPYALGVWLACGHPYRGQLPDVDGEVSQYMEYAGFVPSQMDPNGYCTYIGLWDALCGTLPVDPQAHSRLIKHIPALYRRASKADRLALLQGLMDASGEIDKKGRCMLCLTDPTLADDALELVRSLGIKARMMTEYRDDDMACQIQFKTPIPVFRLGRKADRLPDTAEASELWNYIVSIRHVASEHGKCIHVVHPEHLYLAGGFVPTHNTECAKFFTQFVKKDQRVITIEDSPEWHYHEINPYHDCVEMRVNPDFDYAKAIKTCLRQNPKWIMLSEARSVEVKYLIESWSTGVNGVTTIHTDDIRKIPSRLLNMMANRDDADRLENDIYDFVNVAMLVRRKAQRDGSAHRYIDQMGFLYREDGKNKIHMLVKNGELVSDELPEDIAFKLSQAEIKKPFECPELDDQIGDIFHYTYLPKEQPVPDVPEPAPEVPAAPKTLSGDSPKPAVPSGNPKPAVPASPAPKPKASKAAPKPKPKAPMPKPAVGGILPKRGATNDSKRGVTNGESQRKAGQ